MPLAADRQDVRRQLGASVRVNVTYFDQNESFARALPASGLSGTVARDVALNTLGEHWSVVELDHSFEYQGRQHREVLIRSRWQGQSVGDREPTSVFILLKRTPDALQKQAFEATDFELVAWGIAETLTPNV